MKLAAALLVLSTGAASADPACIDSDTLISEIQSSGGHAMVVTGWMGEALANEHDQRIDDDPIPGRDPAVVLLRRQDAVLLSIKKGRLACQPIALSPREWKEIVSGLWGRRA